MTSMTTTELRSETERLLNGIHDPCSVASGTPTGLVDMGLVKTVNVGPAGDVEILLRLTSPFCEMIGFLKSEVLAQIEGLPGCASVAVSSDSGLDWSVDKMSVHAQQERVKHLELLGIRRRESLNAGSRDDVAHAPGQLKVVTL